MNSVPRTNILFVEGNIDGTIGGSYFSLLFLIEGLDKTKFNPVVVFRKEHSLIDSYEKAGATVAIVPIPRPVVLYTAGAVTNRLLNAISPFAKLLQKLINFGRSLPLAALRNVRFLRKHKIDLVHLNNSVLRNHDWVLASKLARIRCTTHERGINPSYTKLAKMFAPRLDGIVCISEAVRKSLVSGGIRNKKMPVIYNGIDPLVMQNPDSVDIRANFGLPQRAILVGVVGNIKYWKGQETAVRALPQVLDQFADVYCVLIGDVSTHDSEYRDRLTDIAHNLKISDHVIYTGYTKNVSGYMNDLDIVLHTSVEPEPFGRVLIEAMSLGKPLIGAAAGAVPEIVLNGQTGLTFTPGDAESLADCINILLSDTNHSHEMATAGTKRLDRLFHIDTCVAATERFLLEILD